MMRYDTMMMKMTMVRI